MGQRRLILVRHGQSVANRDRIVLGRSAQVPLTELGRQQAEHAAERVAAILTDQDCAASVQIYSSDALRARQTAAPIASRLGLTVSITELLAEQSLGDLEGRPVSELAPAPVPAGFDITEVAWGGGESIAQVHARMRRLLDWLPLGGATPWCIVLVGHQDAFRVLLAVLAGRGHREIDWAGDGLGHGEVRLVLV